jgi:hypothetical protein
MPKIIPLKNDIFVLDDTYQVKKWDIYHKRWKKTYHYGRVDFNPIRFPKEWIGKEIKIKVELVTNDKPKEQPKQPREETIKPLPISKRQRQRRASSPSTIHYREVSSDDDVAAKNIFRM